MKLGFLYAFTFLIFLSFSTAMAQESDADLARKYNKMTEMLKEVQREGFSKVSLSQKFYNKLGVTESQLIKSYGRGKINNDGIKTITYSNDRTKTVFVYFINNRGIVYKSVAHLLAGPTKKSLTKKSLGTLEYFAAEGFQPDSDWLLARGSKRIKTSNHYIPELGIWELILETI